MATRRKPDPPATTNSAGDAIPRRGRARSRSRVPLRMAFSSRMRPELFDAMGDAVDQRSRREGKAFSIIDALDEAVSAWVEQQSRMRDSARR